MIYYIYGDFLSPSKFPLFHLTTGQMSSEQLGNWPLDNMQVVECQVYVHPTLYMAYRVS